MEVSHQVLVPDTRRCVREHMLIFDVNKCKDLVYLQSYFDESSEIWIIEHRCVIESELLVLFCEN